MKTETHTIGTSILRFDAQEKLTGEAPFCADLKLDTPLCLKALRSRYPHARINGIDIAEAMTIDGVVRIFTAVDIPGTNRFGILNKDQPLLADDKVRSMADLVALVAAHDVGKAIHPEHVIGQINGGVAMGVGFALMEEFEQGATLSMKDYHIPTIADMPEVTPIIVEAPEPTGPFGAKGVGEPALIPTAPAIVNALADALGERIYDLPANLEGPFRKHPVRFL